MVKVVMEAEVETTLVNLETAVMLEEMLYYFPRIA
jgi:hypothetical protein